MDFVVPREIACLVFKLSHHALEIPSAMFLGLANEIEVRVEFTVSPADDPAENMS